ncbi:hypothetical protein MKW98_015387 [Papaver atlanticum]|uniref:Fe2OG dioxygenase domain-containing protein n=1 Tax=Papaver atlanticum TaxID=357466 RepID=A0AAD4X4R3_9MAGN|nr:hypothetical protein MKW98_015387 [Papaver atlanticum]
MMSCGSPPIVVPSVYELVKEKITEIPDRYIRTSDLDHTDDSTAKYNIPVDHSDDSIIKYNIPVDHSDDSITKYNIPVIDVEGLLSGESVSADSELENLHSACRHWGFFQVVNHGISSLVTEKLKLEIQKLFELPVEEKRKLCQEPGNTEGFGQHFVVSDDQKLDWSDMFYITSLPTKLRKPHLFAGIPLLLREALEAYSLGLKNLNVILLGKMAKALKMDSDEMEELFNDCSQRMKLSYYPPCPKSQQVLGMSPHSDAAALSIVLQLNETEGLQIRKDGKWIPVKPIPGALVVNIGDMIEVTQ